jgi:aspartate/methionine/tyrosine aminotransferase
MQESKAESEDVMSEGAAPELLLAGLRHAARDAPESGIVEVMNYGRRRNGVIGLWAGEGDLSTPAFITEAAARALAAGETFYTWQRGIPELRRALAGYHTRLYGREFSAEEIFVTGSGMQAIQIALAMTAGEGDEVVIPTPTWPNAAAAAGIAGARPVSVAMTFGNQGWTPRSARGGHQYAHACDRGGLAIKSHRMDGKPRRSRGAARDRASP